MLRMLANEIHLVFNEINVYFVTVIKYSKEITMITYSAIYFTSIYLVSIVS